MTLNITVLTPGVIFQSADYRLFNTATNRPELTPSTKAVILAGIEWTGFVTYTGIGRVGAQDTSDFIREWLASADGLTFDGVVETIRSAASSWTHRHGRGHPHTFVVAGFVNATATAAIVSNFERWHGAETGSVTPEFFTSLVATTGRPEVIVTGQRRAVPREQRRSLQRLAERQRQDPARIRRALAAATSNAAKRFPDLISEDCFVYSQDLNGRGHEEVFGSSRTTLPHVIPEAAHQQIESLLDEQFGPGQWTMAGATFESSRDSSDPPPPCSLTLSDKGLESAHTLVELAIPNGRRATPRAVNTRGVAVGEGTPVWRGPNYPCSWPTRDHLEFLPHLGGLGGQAFAINDDGRIVGHSETPERASKACVWRLSGEVLDIGSPLGRYSGARAINERGDIAGWVSIHPQEGGQAHFRPAFWPSTGSPVVLEDLGGGWGEAVDIDESGMVTVTVHNGTQVEAGLWDGQGLTRLGQLSSNVRAFYPKRLTAEGATIGTAIMRNHSREIATCDASGKWSSLGDGSHGRELMAADSSGNLVGREDLDHYSVPWIWRSAAPAFVLLPHYRHHHHQPMMISEHGWIVGSASSDNCSHPTLWVPN